MVSGRDHKLIKMSTLTNLFSKAAPFIRPGSIYMVFAIFNRAIPFLFLPILTRYIDPTGFGTISVLTIVTSLAMPIIGMNSNTVLFQRYYKLDPSDRIFFLNDCYKIIFMISLVIMIVAVPISPLIERHLKISLKWFEIAIMCAAAGMVTTVTTSLYQIKKQAFPYGLFQTTLMFTNVGLTLFLVVYLKQSWQGRVLAILASAVPMSLIALYLNFRGREIDFARMRTSPQMPSIVRLGGALIPSTITGWAIAMSDRFFLTSMTSLELVGIYSVGVMISQITSVFLDSLGMAYQPHIYQHGHSDDERTLIRVTQGIYLIIIISLATAAAVTLIAPFVIHIMVDARYHTATKIVGWICLSYAFMSIAGAFQGLILSMEENIITAYVSGITLIVSLVSNYVLIGRFGVVGAAMANSISSFSSLVLMIVACVRYKPMPWFDRRVFEWVHLHP